MAEDSVLGDGKITEEGLAKLKELIGTKLRIPNIFNQYVSQEAIRNYVNGIGDINPLYRDEEYAQKTRYGKLIAPPNWLYSVFPTYVPVGLPGVHGFHSGNDWEFYQPIFCGDTIYPECIYRGFEEKKSKFAGRIVITYMDAMHYNQKGELVAKAKEWSVRAERSASRASGKYHHLQLPHPWKEEELARIEEEVLAEEVRGSRVRFWEDTEVGEELKPVVKGPFGLTDMVAYCVGAQPVVMAAHGVQLRYYRKHPAWAFRDPDTCALEPIYAVHYNKRAANAAGLPYPYNAGVQTQSWLINLLTNWMGDEGWLKRNYAEYRRFIYFSDAVRFTGKVIKKYVDDQGEYCVDIETHAMNQRAEDVAPGQSTVILPSRKLNEESWPVARRLAANK